jgi:hypothetical protein
METVACLRSKCHYTPTRREGAILQYIVSPSVRPFTLSLKMSQESQLLLQQTKVCIRVRRNRTWNREKILTIHVSINLCTGSQACIMFVNVELIVPSSFSSLLQNFFFRGNKLKPNLPVITTHTADFLRKKIQYAGHI